MSKRVWLVSLAILLLLSSLSARAVLLASISGQGTTTILAKWSRDNGSITHAGSHLRIDVQVSGYVDVGGHNASFTHINSTVYVDFNETSVHGAQEMMITEFSEYVHPSLPPSDFHPGDTHAGLDPDQVSMAILNHTSHLMAIHIYGLVTNDVYHNDNPGHVHASASGGFSIDPVNETHSQVSFTGSGVHTASVPFLPTVAAVLPLGYAALLLTVGAAAISAAWYFKSHKPSRF